MNIKASPGGLDALMTPKSIAVVGASRNRRKWGRRVLENLVDAGFEGQIYGVNPAAREVDSTSNVRFVPTLDYIDDSVDVAFLALPAQLVPEAALECIRNDVRAMVITSSGFSEVGARGDERQKSLLRAADSSMCRIIGPNSYGFYASGSAVNLTPQANIPPGRVALLSQSGNVAIALAAYASDLGFGYSHCIGLGNQADVGVGELLCYLSGDPSCDVIACYIEGIGPSQGRALTAGLEACRGAGKPVVVLRGGRSAAGSYGVGSHTGSLASSERSWHAVFSEYGVTVTNSTDEMAYALKCISDIPTTAGRVMIMTNGGGDSILAADAAADAGLSLAVPTSETRDELEPLIPADAPRTPSGNPVTLDTAGGVDDDPELIARCARVVAKDPNVDLIVIGGLFGGHQHLRDRELVTARALVQISQACPIALQSAYSDTHEEPLEILKAANIPVFRTSSQLMRAISKTTRSAERSYKKEDSGPGGEGPARQLRYEAAARLLESYGVHLPAFRIVPPRSQVDGPAAEIGYPLCLKVVSPEIVHKSDVNGVVLGIQGQDDLEKHAEAMRDRFPGQPVLLVPMLEKGFEMIIGTMCDPALGPMIMVGRGGVWTEVEDDIQIAPAPVDQGTATRMVRGLHCAPILYGYRHLGSYDTAGLIDLIRKVSTIAADEPSLIVELNPVIVTGGSTSIADVRIMEERENRRTNP